MLICPNLQYFWNVSFICDVCVWLSIMQELQQCYGGAQAVTREDRQWEKGDFCAVQYSIDGKWYRGRVVEVDAHELQVKSHNTQSAG